MDFFQHQDDARKRSLVLVALFFCCVLAIVFFVYLPVVVMATYADMGVVARSFENPTWWWQTDLLLMTFAAIALSVGGASAWKIHQLSSGGASVALMLGGKLVDPATTDAAEKRLINVVEEMAIASGVPVPLVFVLDQERGLNAFAAGYSMEDAAVAVTRGGLDAWNRDELQGVIAHEFSHILNGDMRLNIRMMGWLHGILFLTLIGRFLLYAASGSNNRRRTQWAMDSNPRHNDRGGFVPIFLLGATLWLVGSIGMIFARLLKGGVSRQREFLADAAAVQFTRNPNGLAGALVKVAGVREQGEILHERAEEASHLFFGAALRPSMLGSLFATHPPLRERVRRLNPAAARRLKEVEEGRVNLGEVIAFLAPKDAQAEAVAKASVRAIEAHARQAEHVAERAPATVAALERPVNASAHTEMTLRPEALLADIGELREEHLEESRSLLEAMPESLREAAHTQLGAIALLYLLVLDRTGPGRDAQMERLRAMEHEAVPREIERLQDALRDLPVSLRLPLLELTTPALRTLSAEQREQFRRTVEAMVKEESQLTLFQFVARKVILRRLRRASGEGVDVRPQYFALGAISADLALLLSVLARVGNPDDARARRAFEAGRGALKGLDEGRVRLQPPAMCTFLRLEQALDRLELAAPHLKRRVIEACTHCVLEDGVITVGEAELYRVFAEALEVPVPPLLPRG